MSPAALAFDQYKAAFRLLEARRGAGWPLGVEPLRSVPIVLFEGVPDGTPLPLWTTPA